MESKDNLNWQATAFHQDNRNAHDRATIEIRADIKQIDIISFPSLLKDLSTSGFKLSCAAKLNRLNPLMIQLPKMEILIARIMWVDNMYYGCKFESPLHPSLFDHIVNNANLNG